MRKGSILIVEDCKEISQILKEFLEQNDYEVECAYDGRQASKMLQVNTYLIVLMDLMLPFVSGEDLIKQVRAQTDTPVICLSAKSQVETRLEVLRMGADDYILKPFDLDEVLVRIEVVLRRSGVLQGGDNAKMEETILTCGDLQFFLEENRVTYKEENIALTYKELQILRLLLQHPDKTFTKPNLYEVVWNDTYYYDDNTVNVHVSNLRNKLKKATGQEYIETVWGIGYHLKKEE